MGKGRGIDRGVPFIDVRTQARWDLGHIPGATLLDLKTNFTESKLLAVAGKDKEVVIHCEGPKCLRSSEACAQAVSWSFAKVYYFRDGFPGWKVAGYPISIE